MSASYASSTLANPGGLIVCPPHRGLAMRLVKLLPCPDRGRLYMVTMDRCFKIGSSHRVHERMRQALWCCHSRQYPLVSAIIGAETEAYRDIEKAIHRMLTEYQFAPRRGFWKPREVYDRNERIEYALMAWFKSGSPDDLTLIDAAVHAEALGEGTDCDSAGKFPCWKCGAMNPL